MGAARPRPLQHHITCLLLFVYGFLLFLCLSCPPSERVLFSQLLVIEGGRKQTQIKAQSSLVQRLCLCAVHVIEINAGVDNSCCGCALYPALLAFSLPLRCLLSPFSLAFSYSTTSNILIHAATPRQVGGCGPGDATGEEGKYQRRSGRGGAEEVEGKPNR